MEAFDIENIYEVGHDIGRGLDKTVITIMESRLNKPAPTVKFYSCNPDNDRPSFIRRLFDSYNGR